MSGFISSWGYGNGNRYGGGYGATPPFFDIGSNPSAPPISMNTSMPTAFPTSSTGGLGTMSSAGPVGVGVGGIGSTAGAGQLGLNFNTANLALSGLSAIGNLWAAFQAQKLAKKQFNYTKRVTDTNLSNQIQTYNDGIVDRANNRAIVEGRDDAYTKKFIDERSLKKWNG